MNHDSRPGAALVLSVGVFLSALLADRCNAWEPNAAQLARLGSREIIVEADVDPSGASGRARAAVWIAAPPALVFEWMTDCARALTFVPNLETCTVIDAARDRSSETILHEVDYSWFLPRTRYVFLAQYQRPQRVEFHEVSGDLEINQGSWLLRPQNDGAATLVTYEVRLKPRMFVPQWLVRRGLRKDLPETLKALRRVTEAAARAP